MERIDACEVKGINESLRTWARPGEFVRPIAIEQVVMADDALDTLVDVVERMAAGGKVLLVCDHTPMRRGGDDLKALVFDRLSRRMRVELRHVPTKPGPCHAKLEAAKELCAELAPYSAVVSVGSGSVTDVTKYARHLFVEANPSAGIRFVSFPTAASVTAFTSALAVLSVDGVKRTISSRAPDAVVCDLRTIADAPAMMTQAGFGDVMARSVAYGDYYLAHVVGMDPNFSALPGRLLAWAEQDMIERAEEVAAAALPGVRAVTEAVLLAGMAMSIVNQTAPISGWEHVISHFFDMTAAYDRREQALHGGQVGVATLVSARAYERSWKSLDLDRITAETPPEASAQWRSRFETTFSKYDPAGAMVAEIWRDYDKKMTQWRRSAEARRRFAAAKRAGEFEPFLTANVRTSEAVDAALARAGAPRTFGDLDRPISFETARAAVQFSHLIRARFTLGDLLDQSGWLKTETAAALLK
jgi:glycerol-1-phosphate dehydrogenase [NAD(P)+]